MRVAKFFSLPLLLLASSLSADEGVTPAGATLDGVTAAGATVEGVTPEASFVSEASFAEILPKASNGTPFWFMSVDATAFSAIRDTAVSQYELVDGGVPLGPLFNNVTSDQMTAAPRITIGGAVANGWGFQSTYWDFNQTTSQGFAGLPPGGLAAGGLQVFGESAASRAYTFDLEATRQFSALSSIMTANLGARYALLEHNDSSFAVGIANTLSPFGPDIYTMSNQAKTGFHGTGLTYGLSGILPTSGPVSFYGGGRLSNLFGSNQSSAISHIVGTGEGGRTTANAAADSSSADHLFIAESNIGLIWHHSLKSRNSRIFAKAGFEYQYWNAAADPSEAVTSAALIFSGAGNAAFADDLETHFVGFSVGAGYAW